MQMGKQKNPTSQTKEKSKRVTEGKSKHIYRKSRCESKEIFQNLFKLLTVVSFEAQSHT